MKNCVVVCCAVGLFSCAPPVTFKSVTLLPTGPGCTTPSAADPQVLGGLLDLAGGQVAYFAGVTFESHLGAGTVLDSVNFSYTTTPKRGAFKAENVKLLALLPKEAGGTISFPMNMIGPNAAATITEGDLVSTDPGDAVVLNTSVSFVGHVQGGSSFETDTVTFPVKLVHSPCTRQFPPQPEELTCGVEQDRTVNCQ